jgi:hypothetical protein
VKDGSGEEDESDDELLKPRQKTVKEKGNLNFFFFGVSLDVARFMNPGQVRFRVSYPDLRGSALFLEAGSGSVLRSEFMRFRG